MAETTAVDPVDSLIRRQSVSEANHVNRIRSANSKRLSVILSSREMVSYLHDSGTRGDLIENEENTEKQMSMSDFSNRRKSHHDCVESLDELRTKISNQSLVDLHHSKEKGSKLSLSPNLSTTRRSTIARTSPVMERRSSTGRARRRSTVFQAKTTEKPESNKSRKPSVMENNRNVDLQKQRKSSLLRKSSIKSNETSQSEFDKLLEISDSKGNIISKDLPPTRDAIVLKWLHEVNCPLSEKKEKSISDFSEMNRSPIRILKKVSKASVRESKDKLLDKKISSSARKSKLQLEKEEKIPTSEENGKIVHSHYEEPKNSDSTEEAAKYVSGVEMNVTELGKLQIILDLKELSSEDAAIIIWIDDIPKSYFTPKYGRRLSLVPEPDLLTLGIPKKASQSSELEDMPSQRPDIYFPPVTILKNTAVGSKYGLRDYGDNSALYKRCNIKHIEWEFDEE